MAGNIKTAMKSRFWFSLFVGLALICGLGFLALREREPRYQGRALSEWLAELRVTSPSSESIAAAENAEKAVRAIGKEAIPFLMKMFRAEDSTLEQQLLGALGLQAARGDSPKCRCRTRAGSDQSGLFRNQLF